MPDLGGVRTARQMTLFLMAGFVAAAILLAGAGYVVGKDAIGAQIDARIDTEMAALRRLQKTGGDAALLNALAEREAKDVNSFGYLLADRANRRIAGDIRDPRPGPGRSSAVLYDDGGHRVAARALTADLGAGLRLTVAVETAPTAALLRTTIIVFALVLLLLILLAVGCGLAFGRAIRARLEQMNRTAVAIGAGQLTSRIAISDRGDEFDRLALTLNAMLDRIEALVANVRHVSSELAHELRTPVTHLQNRLERLLHRFEPDTPEHGAIDAAIEDSEGILALFAALLRIAEVESGSVRRHFTIVDLSHKAQMLVESYAAVAEDRGHTLRFSIAPGLLVEGDAELLSQAIINLIENAVKHCPKGTAITVRLARERDDTALVEVADTGPGVAETDRARLTRRYMRLNLSAVGYGLGLSLVAAIVEAHRGRIGFGDNAPGFVARLAFPLSLSTAGRGLPQAGGPVP